MHLHLDYLYDVRKKEKNKRDEEAKDDTCWAITGLEGMMIWLESMMNGKGNEILGRVQRVHFREEYKKRNNAMDG